jgi:hypothetical protein
MNGAEAQGSEKLTQQRAINPLTNTVMMTTSTEPVPEVIEQKSKRRWNAERWISEFVVIVAVCWWR